MALHETNIFDRLQKSALKIERVSRTLSLGRVSSFPSFGRYINPVPIMRVDYAHLIGLSSPRVASREH